MLPLRTARVVVNVEPTLVLGVPLGNPAGRDGGRSHGRWAVGSRSGGGPGLGSGVRGVAAVAVAVAGIGMLGLCSLRGVVAASICESGLEDHRTMRRTPSGRQQVYANDNTAVERQTAVCQPKRDESRPSALCTSPVLAWG